MKRVLTVMLVLVLLWGLGSFFWVLRDLPAPKFVLRYGLPPAGGPTGRRTTVEGVTFVEIDSGYCRVGSCHGGSPGDLLGRICARLRLPWGNQPTAAGNEAPVHWVEFRRAYWIAETETTLAQYRRFIPGHQGGATSEHRPVTEVSFEEALAFCHWLAGRGGLDVRLPSESEWENACRAGSEGDWCFGDDEGRLPDYAWFAGNYQTGPREVALGRPNGWGLFDMHGNVGEWCADTFHPDYAGAPADGSPWTEGGVDWAPGLRYRVVRGGSYEDPASRVRSAFRTTDLPADRAGWVGFRPAASSR